MWWLYIYHMTSGKVMWPFPFWEKIIWLDSDLSWHQTIYKQVSSELASLLRITYVNNTFRGVYKISNFLFGKKWYGCTHNFLGIKNFIITWPKTFHLLRITHANNANRELCKILLKSIYCLIGLPPSILSIACHVMPSQILFNYNDYIWGQKIILI